MATPREILIDAEGRVMRRADGDLATPDCPECCGETMAVRADLCTTTPDYANVHPKRIYIDCPPDGYVCHDPATKRLVKYTGNGHCYRPNYSGPGPVVCEPLPAPGIDDVYVGAAAGAIVCLAPSITCNSSTCKVACAGDPDCCEVQPADCTLLPNCACQDGPTCDCGRKFVVVWSAGSVEEQYDSGGAVVERTTKTASGFMIWTATCQNIACTSCELCGLPGGGMRTVVEGTHPSDTWTDYNPPFNCSTAFAGGSACGGAWGHVVCFFPEVGGSDMQTWGCNHVENIACSASQDGYRNERSGAIRCDGFALSVVETERDSSNGCKVWRKKTTTASGSVSRIIECGDALTDARRPGAMELL